jgi:hypothetical protein
MARGLFTVRGYYQYNLPSHDPVEQALAFQRIVGPLQENEFLIGDLEEGEGDLRAWHQKYFDTLTADPHEWTYSGLYFARTHLPGVKVEWLAAYQAREPTDQHQLWQNQDNYQFPGIAAPSDASIFNGTIEDLIQAIGWGKVTPNQEVDMPYVAIEAGGTAQYLVDGNKKLYIPDTVPDSKNLVARFGQPVPLSKQFLAAMPDAK